MATGTGNGQPQKATRQRVDSIVEFIRHRLCFIAVLVVLGTEAKKTEGDQVIVVAFGGWLHQVTGDLQTDELVVGQIIVE